MSISKRTTQFLNHKVSTFFAANICKYCCEQFEIRANLQRLSMALNNILAVFFIYISFIWKRRKWEKIGNCFWYSQVHALAVFSAIEFYFSVSMVINLRVLATLVLQIQILNVVKVVNKFFVIAVVVLFSRFFCLSTSSNLPESVESNNLFSLFRHSLT